MLNLAALNFNGVEDEDLPTNDVTDFFSLLESSVLIGLCRERVVGEPATEVVSNIGTVRVERNDFSTIGSQVVNLGCDDCSGTTLVNSSVTVRHISYDAI